MTKADRKSTLVDYKWVEGSKDPNERIGQYTYVSMNIEFPDGYEDFWEFTSEHGGSVAEDLAALIEHYILTEAEGNFQGEIIFRVQLPAPMLNPHSVLTGWWGAGQPQPN